MDDVRIGRLLRALRRRKGLRQVDLAHLAGVSQASISVIERGHLSTFAVGVLRRVFAGVEARYDGLVVWRGGELDRLLDERHAVLVGQFAGYLRSLGWEPEVEVTFSVYGDRGSIDILAVRPAERVALVNEIKTELNIIDDTIRRLDVKDRLASGIVQERFGWRPTVISRLIVIAAGATARRRVERHDSALSVAFPARGSTVRQWLAHPTVRMSGLLFVEAREGASSRRPRSNISRSVARREDSAHLGPIRPQTLSGNARADE